MARLRWGLIGAGDIVRKRVAAALRDARGSELIVRGGHRERFRLRQLVGELVHPLWDRVDPAGQVR